jgi:hypothetical protein
MAKDKKKKKSRFKKILKTIGKVAALGGAAYGASKLFGGRRKGRADILTEGDIGIGSRMPSHLGETFHTRPERYGAVPDRIRNVASGAKSGPNTWRDYIPWKHGGSVTGIAKRGFGRALMKGKK